MANVDQTLTERGTTYGDFRDNGATAQRLKELLRETAGWARCTPAQREALDQICSKLSRIANGDPQHADSWHDIAGYAELGKREAVPVEPASSEPALALPPEGFDVWFEPTPDPSRPWHARAKADGVVAHGASRDDALEAACRA